MGERAASARPAQPGAPKWSKATERGRYYTDPRGGPDLVSVTNVLSTAVSKPAITGWAVKETAEYCVNNRMRVARLAVKNRPGLLREIKRVHRDARDKAANLGSRIHHRAHMMALGAPYPPDQEVDPYARQLMRWWASWRVDPQVHIEAAEMTVAHRKVGYAGTLDCLIWLPTGPGGRLELWLVDYKTSATRPASQVYVEQDMQLAALRFARTILLEDGSELPMPRVHRAAVLNLRRRSRALVPMAADKEAFDAFCAAVRTTRWLHTGEGRAYSVLLPPTARKRSRSREVA